MFSDDLSCGGGRCVPRFRLREPDVSVRRNLDDKDFVAFVQTIEKRTVTTAGFVRCPRHHLDAVGLRAIDQIERHLRLGAEHHIVRHARFFRRAVSLAHSSGRYKRASSRQSNPGVEYARATWFTQFSTFPRWPLYCRLTPTVSRPLLAVPVSSTQPTASG